MTIPESAQAVLDRLAETLQCGPLAFDKNNRVELGVDEDMGAIIYLSEETQGLVISVIAGRVDDNDADLLFDLLCGNYMWGFTGGGNMGIDRETSLLSIHRVVELPLDLVADPTVFEDVFAALAGAARYWRARLNPEATATVPAPSGSTGMIRI
ncbi:MAG: type III secretion system chaperone [Desulfovibrio sp.]|nr:type III secretion system chaperone [Desulfovibrio sp.]